MKNTYVIETKKPIGSFKRLLLRILGVLWVAPCTFKGEVSE